ncbi:DUF1007 family protein [Paracoccus sp. SM22M-07]|uniref:DUF1007 family protein n=1 Tax=Paracoccus sp. SM22M-07 TaxID=1520813 RepID=UPI00092100C1|nr:DUF1007 family protein [Paracoccus sp. SM22M-07]OJH45322.1 hypothetical protein IE00_06670 [Paracoccus sp. SM22M-07]
MNARLTLMSLALTLAPLAAGAHPHVFIDAGLRLAYRDDALQQVQVEWAYDAFYSLLIIEDLGLDPDGDGILTQDELQRLQGFDADWEPGFDGRLFLSVDDRAVAMGPGTDFKARYQDGQLISTHLRTLETPLAQDAPLTIQVYDPEYYVQFSMPDAPLITGRAPCRMTQQTGDPQAAAKAYDDAVEAALAQVDGTQPEMLTVDIGNVGADQVRIDCGAGG